MKDSKGSIKRFAFVRSFVRWMDRSGGNTTIEFAVVSIPFIALLLYVMEVSYDLYTQEILDRSLYLAARQIQTGNAQNAVSGTDFITKYMAPNLTGLLSPSNLYVKVQTISPAAGQDYYDFTSGSIPLASGALDLLSFASSGFCNAGPGQLLLISAVYIGPTMIGGLIPNLMTQYYNGSQVHATLSTLGVVSEAFKAATPTGGAASACS